MQVNYMVVRQRDDQPVEVIPFEDFDGAVRIFEDMRLDWTETYICRVIGGEGHALNNADDLQTAHNKPSDEICRLCSDGKVVNARMLKVEPCPNGCSESGKLSHVG